MFTSQFWKDTAERVLSTMAQALLAVIGADAFVPTAVESWQQGAVIVLLAGLMSLLKCIIAIRVGQEGTPSLVTEAAYDDE